MKTFRADVLPSQKAREDMIAHNQQLRADNATARSEDGSPHYRDESPDAIEARKRMIARMRGEEA